MSKLQGTLAVRMNYSLHNKEWAVEQLSGSLKSVRTQALAILQVHIPQCDSDVTTHGGQGGCSSPRHHVLPTMSNMELSISQELCALSFIPHHSAHFPAGPLNCNGSHAQPLAAREAEKVSIWPFTLHPRCYLCVLRVFLVCIFNSYFSVAMC